MKSVNLVKFALPALLLVSASAFAQISGTAHNLKGTDAAADGGQICIYCHTPHSSNDSASNPPPLWNKNVPDTSTGYPMYSSVTFSASGSTVIGPQSDACLSCHDGTIATDSMLNAAGIDQGTNLPGTAFLTEGNSNAFVGTDLSNDHPIGFDYVVAQAADVTGLKASPTDMVFFGDQMECASCHDVHSATYDAFLRADTVDSAICLACHTK